MRPVSAFGSGWKHAVWIKQGDCYVNACPYLFEGPAFLAMFVIGCNKAFMNVKGNRYDAADMEYYRQQID